MLRFPIGLILLLVSLAGFGQKDIAKVVTMDEFVISAAVEDFEVEDFIQQVTTDTTFYQAFLNLKYFPHDMKGAMVVYDKAEDEKATLQRKARQFLNTEEEKWVEITYERTNGRIRKRNGEWKYLTAEVYDEVFFPSKKREVNNKMVQREQNLDHSSKMEKHKAQLKKMLFNPGAPIENVPFIGNKMAIFYNTPISLDQNQVVFS